MASPTVNSGPVANSPSGNAPTHNSGSRPTLRPSANPKSSDGGRRQSGSPLDGGQRYVALSFPLRLLLGFLDLLPFFHVLPHRHHFRFLASSCPLSCISASRFLRICSPILGSSVISNFIFFFFFFWFPYLLFILFRALHGNPNGHLSVLASN
jgi:hypothetical protein